MKYEDYVTNLRFASGNLKTVILGRAAEDPEITFEQLEELEEEARKPGYREEAFR